MANHKQALKRYRQSLKRAERNRYYKTTARTFLKRARASLEAGDRAEATEAVQAATAYLDRVACRGVIPKGRADRLKSRLALQLAKL